MSFFHENLVGKSRKKLNSVSCYAFLLIILNQSSNYVNCLNSELNLNNSRNVSSGSSSCKGQYCPPHDDHLLVKTLDYLYNDIKRSNDFNRERLMHSSIVYGLISIVERNNINSKCFNDLMTIQDGIHKKEIWAMKCEYLFYGCSTYVYQNSRSFTLGKSCRAYVNFFKIDFFVFFMF